MTFLRWSAFAMLLGVSVFGCSQSAPPPAPQERNWQGQVSDVLAGKSDEIHIQYETITDAHLAEAPLLTQLVALTLEQSEVTDQGVRRLADLPNLQRLKIRGGAIGDDGVKHLSRLTELRSVNLPQGSFTDQGLASLAQLPHLEQLRFGSSKVTDEGLKHIANMKNLRFLHLIHAPITDAGLQHLHGMTQLESFYLDGGQATEQGLGDLLKALPGLHIHLDQRHLDNDPHRHDHAH